MKGRVVKLAGNLFLTKSDFETMAKDLDANTLVFCHYEVHTKDDKECIRHSTKGDHCYGCQPLIASTKDIEGVLKITESDTLNDLSDGEHAEVEYSQLGIFKIVLLKK